MLFAPTTASGRWSVLLMSGSLLALAALFVFINLGVKGGQTWFEQPLESGLLLTTPLLLCAGLAIAGGVAGGVALIRERGRALVAVLPVAWALVVLAFIAGEFTNPH
jgi:hypothetical protein